MTAASTKTPLPAATLSRMELPDDMLLDVNGGSLLVYFVRTKAAVVSSPAALTMGRDEFIAYFLANTDFIAEMMVALSTASVIGFFFGGNQATIFRSLSESDRREIAAWTWDNVHSVFH